jgi:hypothetical protein
MSKTKKLSTSLSHKKKNKQGTVKFYSQGRNSKSKRFRMEDTTQIQYNMALEYLNEKLKIMNNNLYIEAGLISEFPDNSSLLEYEGTYGICIYKKSSQGNKCISGIGFEVYPSTTGNGVHIEINSKTHENHRQKGLNKLMRAILIFLTPVLSDEKVISMLSVPENKLSAYSLMKYFDTNIDETINQDFLAFKRKHNKQKSLYQLIDEAYKSGNSIQSIEVPITKKNLKSAKQIIDIMMDHMFEIY